MNDFERTKALLGRLSERTLRSLHDAALRVLNDPATPAQDRVDLGHHVADLAKLVAEKGSSGKG